MGRGNLGSARGASGKGCPEGCPCGRHRSNSGSFDRRPENVEAGRATRFKRKHPLPSVGDRFGELTVIGLNKGPAGGPSALVTVACSCGSPPYLAYDYNLRKGASTRCRACGRAKGAATRKKFWAYADIVPDEETRRRLLQRISACIIRCRPDGHHNYGARGIYVAQEWIDDRRAFLRHLVGLPGWDNPALELDRIRVEKGYVPGNLRFVTHRENCLNKRTVRAMQARIDELEAYVRHLERGPAPQIHGSDGEGATPRP